MPLGVPLLHFDSFTTFFFFFSLEEDILREKQDLPSMASRAKHTVKSPEYPPMTLTMAESQNTSSYKGSLGTSNKSLLQARLTTKLNQAVSWFQTHVLEISKHRKTTTSPFKIIFQVKAQKS